MTRASSRIFRLLMACAPVACTPGSSAPNLEARVDSVLAPLVASHEFSGAVVMTRGDSVVYARGFGMANHEAGVAFTPDTPSDGASLAKPFTASAVWWLVHEGRVDLDAPVREYVPEYPHAGTTVRQLLWHSNGLPDDYAFFDPHFGPGEPRTTPAMLRVVARQQPSPAFTPGTRYQYSSIGYDVGALVVERRSGTSFEEVLRQRFFEPLGMRSSFVRPARLSDWTGVRTMGYRWRDSAWVPVDVYDMEAFRGGSNIYFSARDLGRWAGAHARGVAIPAPVLTAGQEWMTVGGKRADMTGLNWYCDEGRERCYYTGDLNAFHALVYWDRVRKESVAFVSNSSLPVWRRARLGRDLVDVLAGRPRREEHTMAFARFDSTTRSSIAGTYDAPGLGRITVQPGSQSRLSLRVGDRLDQDVFQVSGDVFYVPGLDYWLAFSGASDTAMMHLRSLFTDVTARRLSAGDR